MEIIKSLDFKGYLDCEKLYGLVQTSVGFYITWILLHYTCSHLYMYFCVGNTFYSFIVSPFIAATPFCQGLNWVIYVGSQQINGMWVALGTWLTAKILMGRTIKE